MYMGCRRRVVFAFGQLKRWSLLQKYEREAPQRWNIAVQAKVFLRLKSLWERQCKVNYIADQRMSRYRKGVLDALVENRNRCHRLGEVHCHHLECKECGMKERVFNALK